MDELVSWAARPLLLVVRALWWLIWDLLIFELLWRLGWPVCRALSIGRFPETGWKDADDASVAEWLVVGLGGLLLLSGLLWMLSRLV